MREESSRSRGGGSNDRMLRVMAREGKGLRRMVSVPYENLCHLCHLS